MPHRLGALLLAFPVTVIRVGLQRQLQGPIRIFEVEHRLLPRSASGLLEAEYRHRFLVLFEHMAWGLHKTTRHHTNRDGHICPCSKLRWPCSSHQICPQELVSSCTIAQRDRERAVSSCYRVRDRWTLARPGLSTFYAVDLVTL
jgi:hypothetical protein